MAAMGTGAPVLENAQPGGGRGRGAGTRASDSTGIWALLWLLGSQSPNASKGHRLIDLFNPKLEVKLHGPGFITPSTASLCWGGEPEGPEEIGASIAVQDLRPAFWESGCDLWSQIHTRFEPKSCCSNWPAGLGQCHLPVTKDRMSEASKIAPGTQEVLNLCVAPSKSSLSNPVPCLSLPQ